MRLLSSKNQWLDTPLHSNEHNEIFTQSIIQKQDNWIERAISLVELGDINVNAYLGVTMN